MDWKCKDFKPTHMDFQVSYETYLNVSIHDYKDVLQVNINGPQYFRSAENNMYIEQSEVVFEKIVPPQMDPQLAKNLLTAAAAAEIASKSVMVG